MPSAEVVTCTWELNIQNPSSEIVLKTIALDGYSVVILSVCIIMHFDSLANSDH